MNTFILLSRNNAKQYRHGRNHRETAPAQGRREPSRYGSGAAFCSTNGDVEDVGAIHGGDFVAPMNSEVLTDQEAYDAAELQLGFCVAEDTSLQKMSEWKGCEAD